MLRRIVSGGGHGGHGGDAGIGTPILVMGMALLLTAGVLLFGRIAQADDMRTRAQHAADAAALGALAPLRDQMASMLEEIGADPASVGYWMVSAKPEQSADAYARRNKGRLKGKVHLTGLAGDTAKVEVTTEECQLKDEDQLTEKELDDLRNRRNLCRDTSGKEGIGRTGSATAIAKVIPPSCTWKYYDLNVSDGVDAAMWVQCEGNGREVGFRPGYGNLAEITKLFKIRLVAKEDSQEYNGMNLGPGAEGFGQGNWEPGDLCSGSEMTAERITKRMECVRDQIRELFKVPKGIGCYRPNGGIPGGGEHPLGRACDFMISAGAPTDAEAQLGYNISNWAQANAQRLGIYYIIYRQRIYNPSRANEGWRLMENRGGITANHFDHVHISVLP